MPNPSQSALPFLIKEMAEKIAALEQRCAALEGVRGVYGELAEVTEYLGGSQLTITYASGIPRVIAFNADWTPTVGDNVFVINTPAWSGVICPISSF